MVLLVFVKNNVLSNVKHVIYKTQQHVYHVQVIESRNQNVYVPIIHMKHIQHKNVHIISVQMI